MDGRDMGKSGKRKMETLRRRLGASACFADDGGHDRDQFTGFIQKRVNECGIGSAFFGEEFQPKLGLVRFLECPSEF